MEQTGKAAVLLRALDGSFGAPGCLVKHFDMHLFSICTKRLHE